MRVTVTGSTEPWPCLLSQPGRERERSRVAGWKVEWEMCWDGLHPSERRGAELRSQKIIGEASHLISLSPGCRGWEWPQEMIISHGLGFSSAGWKERWEEKIHTSVHTCTHTGTGVCVFPSFLLTSLWLWAYAFHRPHSGLRTCCPGSPPGSISDGHALLSLQADFDPRVAIPASDCPLFLCCFGF